MSELNEECGVAAIYHMDGEASSSLYPGERQQATRLLPRMLLDMQNRGQLAAGISTYNPNRDQLLDTHKDVGSVNEVFSPVPTKANSKASCSATMVMPVSGTCAMRLAEKDDRSYAQPFERHHLQKT